MKLKKIFAFTLAEVLITLSILGVVAAITVPSLIKRQHRNEVETKLKKMHSAFENAISIYEAENNKTFEVGAGKGADRYPFIKNDLFKYLNISKTCYLPDDTCKTYDVTPLPGASGGTVTIKPGSSVIGGDSTFYVVLKDGSILANNPGVTSYDNIAFYYDINGYKGPNHYNQDVFAFNLSVDEQTGHLGKIIRKAYLKTWSKASFRSTCKSLGDNEVCSAWLYLNNWKIPSDYPWL